MSEEDIEREIEILKEYQKTRFYKSIMEYINEIETELKQEKEKNKGLEIKASELNGLAEIVERDYIHKDKIKDMMKYRESELQQEYKEFGEDTEWKTYKKILEEK